MATFLSRRAALAAATGAGAAAALTACASDIRPLADSSSSPSGEASASASASESASASASASASSSAKKSYKGAVKLDKYEKNGEYVPATAEKKAQNVPKPVVPEKMNEATIEGMYEFLCYWVASFNYMFMTGDFEPLKKADPEGRYANDHANAVLIYSSGKGWVYDTDAPVTIQLLTDAPKKVEGGPNRYDWLGRIIYDPNAKARVEGHDPVPLVDGSTKSEATNFPFDYKDGVWFLLSDEEADSPSSEASSASA
ncbi:MAG: imidazole glycerol phosphate synthase [Rothia mucilaginosa]|nr:imidazole glycerol phosphate synthase [Rothia mucilaginosa]